METRIRVELLPKQYEFVTSSAYETLFSSGIGGGKTYPLCIRLAARASVPGALEVLGRRELEALKKTTLRTLLRGSNAPPVLPPGSYRHYKADRIIEILGGGLIQYTGIAEKAAAGRVSYKAGGLEPTGYAIDQLEELTEDEYVLSVIGRVRNEAGGAIRNAIYATANASHPEHWAALRWGITGENPEPDTRVIYTNPLENPHLPAKYIRFLQSLRGVMRMRLVEGLWVGSDKMVYSVWNRERHRVARTGPWVDARIGVDDGSAAPFAAVLGLIDADGRKHIAKEVYLAGLEEHQKLELIQQLMREAEQVHGVAVRRILVDPEAKSLKIALANRGLPVANAVNDLMLGIDTVRAAFGLGADGRPGLTVDPSCTNLVREIGSYERDPKDAKERPLDTCQDHACDAMRYFVMDTAQPARTVFDLSLMGNAIRKAGRTGGAELVGTLIHDREGKELDLALIDRDAALIAFSPRDAGELSLWMPAMRRGQRPPDRTTYAMFAMAGDARIPSIITIADVTTRAVVGELHAIDLPAERLARLAAMLSIWLGGMSPPTLGWSAAGGGVALEAHLRGLGVPRLWMEAGGKAWTPKSEDWTGHVAMLRAALEAGEFAEASPRFFDEARVYAYNGRHVGPIQLDDNAAMREAWVDRVRCRAGLWRMLREMRAQDLPGRRPRPGSLEEAIENAGKPDEPDLHFG